MVCKMFFCKDPLFILKWANLAAILDACYPTSKNSMERFRVSGRRVDVVGRVPRDTGERDRPRKENETQEIVS